MEWGGVSVMITPSCFLLGKEGRILSTKCVQGISFVASERHIVPVKCGSQIERERESLSNYIG